MDSNSLFWSFLQFFPPASNRIFAADRTSHFVWRVFSFKWSPDDDDDDLLLHRHDQNVPASSRLRLIPQMTLFFNLPSFHFLGNELFFRDKNKRFIVHSLPSWYHDAGLNSRTSNHASNTLSRRLSFTWKLFISQNRARLMSQWWF